MRPEAKSGFKADATTEAPVISAVKLASSTQPSERKFPDPIKTFDISNKTKTTFFYAFLSRFVSKISDRHEECEE